MRGYSRRMVTHPNKVGDVVYLDTLLDGDGFICAERFIKVTIEKISDAVVYDWATVVTESGHRIQLTTNRLRYTREQCGD